eukprot:CAMPEP_0181030934 /NCGR_PEP_ID=MMETSP1070-20121207/5976_1 /TAXON_ID=265543 /ORGANISM="Minutocellus polymorphus, Strain NH13" /LENGTH=909 /DNA_ID=CAMNT_0023108303 /DNA_START=170 /DNA_END=2896 /DNA_ORIENTATION=-
MPTASPSRRIVSADPGLLSAEELLSSHTGGRRKSLEKMIHQHNKEISVDVKPPIMGQIKDKVRWFLEHARIKISYDDFMMIVTLFVLFGDDLRLLSFPPSADTAFAVLNNMCFFLFLIELVLNCWAKSEFFRTKSIWRPKVKGYMFSFFFWLDLLAVVSMIPDILWLSSLLGLGALPGAGSVGTKVGKAGRIGAKTSRVVRMVRLVRLVKLYKITSQRRRERKMIEDLRRLVAMGHIDHSEVSKYLEKMNDQKQSKVGAELSDIITRRVIIAVLMMLCVVPMLSWSPSVQDELEATMFLHAVNVEAGAGSPSNSTNCEYLKSSTNAYKLFMESIVETSKSKDQYLLGLSIEPQRCNSSLALDFDDYPLIEEVVREDAISVIETPPTIIDDVEYSIEATFNLTSFVEDQARAGIYLTIFVIFMLVTMSAQFTGDAQKLVLAPIENMMEMVNLVAEDPLEEFDFSHHMSQTNGAGGQYETRVVQIAIQKITALLRVGFGVAGADIISTNMAVGEGEGSAVLEPMIPGKRVYAIFGFTDIHAFDYCTEKLEDEIMTFVNSVARIVHDEVTRWGGLCNKNLGNAFLMVWRIGDEDELQAVSGRRRRASHSSSSAGGVGAGRPMSPTASSRSAAAVASPGGPASPTARLFPASAATSNVRGLSVDLRRIPGLDIMSDKALIGFLKVVVEINRDKQVLAYRADNRLTAKGSREYKLRMGFGLHAGWAIEGAVGSLQKVDATYLSPHVNMAARMEAASRQFGVSILMTERFVELMSPEAQEHCRKIDVVTVKGSATPMPVYSYDTYQNQTFPVLQAPKFSSLNLEEVLAAQADEYDVHMWDQDEDLLQLRSLSTTEFKVTFKEGVTAYLTGQWEKARQHLEQADEMMSQSDLGGDGPSQTLLNYMKNRDWICPPDW